MFRTIRFVRVRRAFGFALVLTLSLGGVVCAAATLRGDEVRLSAIVPNSGPFAEWSKANTIVMQIVEDEVNASGSINGAKLKILNCLQRLTSRTAIIHKSRPLKQVGFERFLV